MFLDKRLLHSQDESWQLPSGFHSCWNARGSYNPLEFALRLRPDIHKALDAMTPGIRTSGELTFSGIQAFSTYFHETIHWWQHVGSTIGLILSYLYPVQSHLNYSHLKWMLENTGPLKSIRKYNLTKMQSAGRDLEAVRRSNIILNNWHDIEFFRWLVTDPKRANLYINDPYFECVGHSFEMTLASFNWLLGSTIDPNFEILQDSRKWEPEFLKLRQEKVEGFYYGSPVRLSPIGAREIFEGQARFSQLQYLYSASGGQFSWEASHSMGMLSGVYKDAFEAFLKITDTDWPANPVDPPVGLFLLLCDISINPGDGFPFEITEFPLFVTSVDPGIRFFTLCQVVKKNPSFLKAISHYSREEYINVSELLCQETGYHSPLSISETVINWSKSHQGCQTLLAEDATFKFSLTNLPIRVFFSRFLRLQADKFYTPEFFCWPGIWSTSDRNGPCTLEHAEKLFDEHRALFVDKEDGDVYPRTFINKDDQVVLETFNTFYSWNATYELTRQWIIEDGPFNPEFFWLSSKYSRIEMEEWAFKCFEQSYEVKTSQFQLL